MKIRVLKGAHYRVSSGLSQSFAAGSEIDVPQRTAEALIERGEAEKITGRKPSKTKGD